MNILLWSPLGAGTHYHGSGMNAYRLYAANKTKDLKITLVCAYPDQENLDCFDEIVILHKQHSNSPLSYLIYQIKAWRWLRQNAHRFDIFHGIDVFDNTLRPAVYAEKLGLPALIKPAQSKAGFISANRIYRIFGLAYLRRRLIRKVSAVVAINDEIYNDLLSYDVKPDRIHKISNGVDTRIFHPVEESVKHALRKDLGYSDTDFIVLFVGAIIPRKQPHLMIEAVKKLIHEYPNLKVILLGPLQDTQYCNNLVEHAQHLSIQTHIHFAGHQTEVAKFYQMADVFCLPSKNEGMPNSLLEAMACGLPGIVSPISGITEILKNQVHGLYITNNQPISTNLKNYLNHKDILQEHGLMAHKQVIAEFSSVKIFKQYFALFSNIVYSK